MRVDRIHVCLEFNGACVALKAAVVTVDRQGKETILPYVAACHPRTNRHYDTAAEALESARQLVQDILAEQPARVGSEVAG